MTDSIPARGMRDFLPAEKQHREHLLAVLRSAATQRGFGEYETPAVERKEVLEASGAGETGKQMFRILRRGVNLEDVTLIEDLADEGLRFDLTVPLTRFYAQHQSDLPAVFRAFQIGNVWRAERPQAGRYRQFLQTDFDILGEAGSSAELELLDVATAVLQQWGLDEFTFRVNDRRVLDALLDEVGVGNDAARGQALTILDKLDKVGFAKVQEMLDSMAAGELLDKVLKLTAEDAVRLVPSLADVLDADAGFPVVFDAALARGLGYYTGTVFEIAHPASGSSVGGGGRYDGLADEFLMRPESVTPGVGLSLGFERILPLLPKPAVDETTVLLVSSTESPIELIRAKQRLVSVGYAVQVAKKPRKLRSLLTRAQEQGCVAWVDAAVGELRTFDA